MIMDAERFIIRPAVPADSEFVSIGIREAERCNFGIGIFDIAIDRTFEEIDGTNQEASDDTSRYLEHAYLNDVNSHVHYSNFLVAIDSISGEIAACCCNFPYPEFKLASSIKGFVTALRVLGYPQGVANDAFDCLSFLDTAFPDIDYDNSWMFDAVYVAPKFRGHGLARRIVMANLDATQGRGDLTADKGKVARRNLIACAVGNDAAKHVYEKLGFEVIGVGYNEECMKAIRCSGFYMLSMKRTTGTITE